MILCFSGSGNSLSAARIVAEKTNDTLVDIGKAYKAGDFSLKVAQGENLGFVFPIHAWSTPRIVDEFIKKAAFETDNGKAFVPGYCYCVMSYGSSVGGTAGFLEKLLKNYQGIRLDASFSVKNVDNCIYLLQPPTGEKQQKLLEQADVQAKEAAFLIDGKRMVHNEHKGTFGRIASKMTGRENKQFGTDRFHTLPSCIGCGTCAGICPTNTIHMEDGSPVWSGDDCTQCLACINRCPNSASQFGKKTEGRTRYVNPILRA